MIPSEIPADLLGFLRDTAAKMREQGIVAYEIEGSKAPAMFIDFPLKDETAYPVLGYWRENANLTVDTPQLLVFCGSAERRAELEAKHIRLPVGEWQSTGTHLEVSDGAAVVELEIFKTGSDEFSAVGTIDSTTVIALCRLPENALAAVRLVPVLARERYIDRWTDSVRAAIEHGTH